MRAIAQSRRVGTLLRAASHYRVSTRCYSNLDRPWSTPLAKTIGDAITHAGPISIAAYMRQCLTAAHGGYYAKQPNDQDQLGKHGDFVTSPEISQVFGELVGIWTVAEWMAQERRSAGIELIEFGPGRGTLMDDVLRTIRHFKPLADSLESIQLIESDRNLRERQRKLLCDDVPFEEIEQGVKSRSKYMDTPVEWREDVKFLSKPSGRVPFIIAHEFFDALPIHAFQSVAPKAVGASEIQGLAGPVPLHKPLRPRTPQWHEFLVTNTATSAKQEPQAVSDEADPKPDFELSLSRVPTAASLVVPESSARYQALKKHTDSIIEVSPESQSAAALIAQRIGSRTGPSSGAALIIDYGPSSTIPTSTLRGIRAHTRVSPFSLPGRTDLSADVDFTALAEAALKGSNGVEVHGPVEQGTWLEAMGARERAKAMIQKAQERGDTEMAEGVRKGVERLMERGGGGMGKLYKVMAIVPENSGKRRPVGFGGEIT